MATLYELTEEYRQLLEMMEDDTVDPEVLQDTLEGTFLEGMEKAVQQREQKLSGMRRCKYCPSVY